jgi:hypothetical protein
MGWKATAPGGREIEKLSQGDVEQAIGQLGEDPADWQFSMTRIQPGAGGYFDGRKGYICGMPAKMYVAWMVENRGRRPEDWTSPD